MSAVARPAFLVLRPAKTADAAEVFALVRELASHDGLLHEVDGSEDDLRRDLFGPMPRAFCTLATWDGEVAGFALWFYNYSTFRCRAGVHLEDLFVRPGYRGRGIGKALLTQLARHCVDEDMLRLQWSVLDWNELSMAFYTSLGPRVTHEWLACRLDRAAIAALAGARETDVQATDLPLEGAMP